MTLVLSDQSCDASLHQLLGRCECVFTEAKAPKDFSFQKEDDIIMSVSLVGMVTTNSKMKGCAITRK